MDHILDDPGAVSYPDNGRDKSRRKELLGRMQRDKGQRGEREIAENLSCALGIDIERKLGAARDGGHDLEAGGFAVECKRTERPSIGNGGTNAGRMRRRPGYGPCWRGVRTVGTGWP